MDVDVESGKWKVDSGKWKVASGAVPDLTYGVADVRKTRCDMVNRKYYTRYMPYTMRKKTHIVRRLAGSFFLIYSIYRPSS